MTTENLYSAPQSTDFIPLAQQVSDEPVVDSPSSLRLLATATGIMVGIFATCKAIEWIVTRL